ncbi:MAG: hypothetical protein OXI24_05075 [Candidatus Poribacteria bacterium]|nr:hypothetical protein [Candidatus Poribacteria bacterium]
MTRGNPELAARVRHLLDFLQAGYESKSFIYWLTLSPGHPGLPYIQCINRVSGIICTLSVDNHRRSYAALKDWNYCVVNGLMMLVEPC